MSLDHEAPHHLILVQLANDQELSLKLVTQRPSGAHLFKILHHGWHVHQVCSSRLVKRSCFCIDISGRGPELLSFCHSSARWYDCSTESESLTVLTTFRRLRRQRRSECWQRNGRCVEERQAAWEITTTCHSQADFSFPRRSISNCVDSICWPTPDKKNV